MSAPGDMPAGRVPAEDAAEARPAAGDVPAAAGDAGPATPAGGTAGGLPAGYEEARRRWEADAGGDPGVASQRTNLSGVPVKALYGPEDWDQSSYMAKLGFPGQAPYTRGVHATMHRGRPWNPRLVVGLGTPEDYNARMHELYRLGLTGLFVSPCNSHLRGYDADEVDRELLGVCGTLIDTSEDMERSLEGLPFDQESVSIGDTAPYTLTAMYLKMAADRGIPWHTLAGTTNQSDYLSHYAALHMFFRVALPGQKRLLGDHVEWMRRNVPRWNPLSVVGQHYQQAGATPAEAMGLALSAALQHSLDLMERGMAADDFLPRLSFFFDGSVSFFEEVAKFRAGRRIWARLTAERLGAADPRSQRMRFHVQTSGADLTRQQPLNNIARVAVQAMAGIFGGLQSLHTDSMDEAIGSPTVDAARVAVATQHILRHEAHLDDVIDPLAGSYYVEALTDRMEEAIMAVVEDIDAQGGMAAALESGHVQQMIGASSLAAQERIERGEQIVVGVNAFTVPEDEGRLAGVGQAGGGPAGGATDAPPTRPAPLVPDPERPDPARIDAYLERLAAFRARQDRSRVTDALGALARSFADPKDNTYGRVVDAVMSGATHGEICRTVREAAGAGDPLVMV